MKYFSMFTGVGGFELGIADKAQCIGFSEINKYASELLKNKFPKIKNYGDSTKIDPNELLDFDMLCGGFPCQAFSIAGKRKGFQDTRGTLFFEIERILRVKRPRLVFLENVKGLLNHNGGETFRIIISRLSELGYNVQWMVLNSKFFGVPQNRERVFIIGNIRGTTRPEILPFSNNNETFDVLQEQYINTLTRNYQKGESTGSYIVENKQLSQADRIYDKEGISPTVPTSSGGRHIPMIVASRGRNPENHSDRTIGSPTEQILEPNSEGISNTLSSVQKDNLVFEIQSHYPRNGDPKKGGTGLLNSSEHCFALDSSPHYVNKIRRLTPIECERLQGFPDGWTDGFSDSQRYKMMGNAVTVNVIKVIAEKLLK